MERFSSVLRLGDVIDDYCVKCKRLTNHAIVSLIDRDPAKVRCRTCYGDHDYLREVIPPSKKDLKKLELLGAAAATANGDDEAGEDEEVETGIEIEEESEEENPAPPPTAAPVKRSQKK